MEAWDLKPDEIKERLDKMVWSFSRLSSFYNCKYSWYLAYISGQRGLENAYSQFGTLCHETLEKYLKGELDMFTVAQYYQDHYSEYVTYDFPANKYVDLGQKTYEQGADYFNNLMFDFDRYEILGVEKEVSFKIDKYPFKGYIDALYRDKETGEIILLDHKSSSFTYKVNGDVSKKNQEAFQKYVKQEYLYSIPVIEEYGKVDYLTWNMIRDQREIRIPFDMAEFEKTKQWALDTIHKIEEEIIWAPDKSSSYFCNVLCGLRTQCSYRD